MEAKQHAASPSTFLLPGAFLRDCLCDCRVIILSQEGPLGKGSVHIIIPGAGVEAVIWAPEYDAGRHAGRYWDVMRSTEPEPVLKKHHRVECGKGASFLKAGHQSQMQSVDHNCDIVALRRTSGGRKGWGWSNISISVDRGVGHGTVMRGHFSWHLEHPNISSKAP